MGWRDFRKSTLVEKMEKMEKIPVDVDKISLNPLNPFIPPGADFKEAPLSILDHLDETSREAFREYVDLMTGPKFRMPLEQAQLEASRLVLRNLRTLQIQQATKEYRKQGWVKIYSGVLGRSVYLAKDDRAAQRVPDQNIAVFLESDLEAVKGLAPDEARVLLEARMLFGGPIKVQDYSERPHKRKVDGKQVARNFFGKKSDGKGKSKN